MADINGIVTIGSSETPGEATVLLLNEAGDTIVASTTSSASTGAYSFTGLASGTYYVVVMGGGSYRGRAYGPCSTEVRARLTESGDTRITEAGDRRIAED